MSEALARGAAPAVSIVVPVRNEAGNITPLVTEIAAALGGHRGFEVIYVNDGSTDGTESELIDLMASRPWLRQMRHMTSCGQSAAVSSGVRHARASVIVTLDGDGQNDPAFIPALLEALAAGGPRTGLVAGQRVGRKATGFKKLQSRIANAVRGAVLRDGTRVFRSYFTTARGVEGLGTVWSLLDVTPYGRQEAWETSPKGWPQTPPYQWWRRHDEYESVAEDNAA